MRKAVLQTHRHHCAGCSCRWAAEHRPCSGLLSSHRSGLWLHTGHRWEDDASHLSVRCRTYSGPDSYKQKETVIKGMSSIEIGSHAKKWQQQPFVYLTGKSTMSLILSLQIKLLKENRLSWMIRTLGKRHSNSCLEASRCCWHFGQYLKNRVFENSLYQVKQRHQVNSWFRRKKKMTTMLLPVPAPPVWWRGWGTAPGWNVQLLPSHSESLGPPRTQAPWSWPEHTL